MNLFKQKAIFICAGLAVLNICIDFLVFDLHTIQGHLYVVAAEASLLMAMYKLSEPVGESEWSADGFKRFGLTIAFLAVLSLIFKILHLRVLANVTYSDDFSEIFTFAVGPLYGLASIADARIDAIAKALFQCGMCVADEQVPLNEPFIAYLYTAISMVAGEFNQSILWLTLHLATFFTAVILLKIAREVYPTSRHVILVPLVYIAVFDIPAVSLYLFKDGLISLAMVALFYLNCRYLFLKNINKLLFELLSVLLIVFLYQLRGGILTWILSIVFISLLLDRVNWLLHIRILLLSVLTLVVVGNTHRMVERIDRSVSLITNKVFIGSASGLDVQNLTYTTSVENSVFEKLGLNTISLSNFYYAPFVKGALYFVLPLPVNLNFGLMDVLHRLSSLIYAAGFALFLTGAYKILRRRRPVELYLLVVFGLAMATILGAGPILYPRYRILASAFFLIIAAIGASHVSAAYRNRALGVSALMLMVLVFGYEPLYAGVQMILR